MAKGWLFHLTAAQLSELLTNYLACLNAIATTGQSYTIAGRTFTRANLEEVAKMIDEIKQAQNKQSGTRITKIYPDFRR